MAKKAIWRAKRSQKANGFTDSYTEKEREFSYNDYI